MNAPTSLETRLSAALAARADLVDPASLAPAQVPATGSPTGSGTVSPLRRRATVFAAAAAVGVVASVALAVGLLADGDDSSAPDPAPPPTVSDTVTPDPTPDPTPDSRPALDELLPQDPLDYVEPGRPVALRDGATAVVEGDRLLIDGVGDGQLSGALEGIDPGVALDVTRVDLGAFGDGFLVSQTEGGESFAQELYVVGDGGGLVRAEAAGDVRFGTSYSEGFPDGYITWTTGDGADLYTRFQQGGPDGEVWVVYRWEVVAPGEDAGPEAPATDLVATRVGTACFDLQADESKAC